MMGNCDFVLRLLQAGADPSISAAHGTARQIAERKNLPVIVSVIDAHLRRQLRRRLADICCAFRARELPVLVLLECFAWALCESYASDCVSVPLDVQWRVAKRIRDEEQTVFAHSDGEIRTTLSTAFWPKLH